MPRWTAQQVAKIAPDDSSLVAARNLARPGPWSETGATDLLVWGVCQGSGKTPYQVSVDLTGNAFRCSCPSRKFPCKHALALLLLWAEGPQSVAAAGEASDFARDWAESRAERAAGRTAGAAAPEPPDPVTQARRLEARLALMDAGMADFAVWLTDLVRTGTAAARQQPYGWWDAAAARLVDAQVPGLAEQVREMGSEVHRRSDWADHLLAVCGRWWTATAAWASRDELTETELADLRAYVGWAQPSAEVRERDQEAAPGRWLVLGAHRTEDGRLKQQRTWLRREDSDEVVQVLDFAAGGTPLRVPQLAGAVLDVTLARYPGSSPRRALFVDEPRAVATVDALPACGSIDAAHEGFSRQLARSPWSDRAPVSLADVRIVPGPVPLAVDVDGHQLALVAGTPLWLLLALTGGHEANLFGEMDGGRLRPLTVQTDAGLVAL